MGSGIELGTSTGRTYAVIGSHAETGEAETFEAEEGQHIVGLKWYAESEAKLRPQIPVSTCLSKSIPEVHLEYKQALPSVHSWTGSVLAVNPSLLHPQERRCARGDSDGGNGRG